MQSRSAVALVEFAKHETLFDKKGLQTRLHGIDQIPSLIQGNVREHYQKSIVDTVFPT